MQNCRFPNRFAKLMVLISLNWCGMVKVGLRAMRKGKLKPGLKMNTFCRSNYNWVGCVFGIKIQEPRRKLNHLIESVVHKHTDRDIDKGIIENILNEYDKLSDNISYRLPNHIRQKVIKKFGGVKKLPNSLEIDYSHTIKMEYMNNMMCDVMRHFALNSLTYSPNEDFNQNVSAPLPEFLEPEYLYHALSS
jgi:hypothetical protein